MKVRVWKTTEFVLFRSGNNKSCLKPWRKLMQDPATLEPQVLKRTAPSCRWVSNAVSPSSHPPGVAHNDDCLSIDVAEKSFLSRSHPCLVCYHGDPVKLGERSAGRAHRVAVPVPQKQEAVRFASWHRHQERRPPRKFGSTCQRKGEGKLLWGPNFLFVVNLQMYVQKSI